MVKLGKKRAIDWVIVNNIIIIFLPEALGPNSPVLSLSPLLTYPVFLSWAHTLARRPWTCWRRSWSLSSCLARIYRWGSPPLSMQLWVACFCWIRTGLQRGNTRPYVLWEAVSCRGWAWWIGPRLLLSFRGRRVSWCWGWSSLRDPCWLWWERQFVGWATMQFLLHFSFRKSTKQWSLPVALSSAALQH